jgi:hypothetical protein
MAILGFDVTTSALMTLETQRLSAKIKLSLRAKADPLCFRRYLKQLHPIVSKLFRYEIQTRWWVKVIYTRGRWVLACLILKIRAQGAPN